MPTLTKFFMQLPLFCVYINKHALLGLNPIVKNPTIRFPRSNDYPRGTASLMNGCDHFGDEPMEDRSPADDFFR